MSTLALAALAPFGCKGTETPQGYARPHQLRCLAPKHRHDPARLQREFPDVTLDQPTALVRVPGPTERWYATEQTGRLMTFVRGGSGSGATVALDLSDRVVVNDEPGLLGVAVSPRFATTGEVFLFYIDRGGSGDPGYRSVLSRFVSRDGGLTLDPSSEEIVLTLDRVDVDGNVGHNGGHLGFGPDGYLYVALGDGEFGDPNNLAQDRQSLFGKMLRLDVSVKPYGIPPDNPFVGTETNAEIYAIGFRNPWSWSFDRATGDLWLGDVGHESWEEIDRIHRGENYGWRVREGNHCFDAETCSSDGLTPPVYEYSHAEGYCVIGGFVYHGRALPALSGRYVFGDFSTGRISALGAEASANDALATIVTETGLNITGFAEADDGELLVIEHGGTVQRIVPDTDTVSMPTSLKATGCTDPDDATRPSPELIPYDVNMPLWSDGAAKERWFTVPDDQRIHVTEDGGWELPPGSLAMKTFRLDGKPVETRLFVHHADGAWAGYSYEWNDDGTDATLLETGKDKTIGNQTWTFPNRSQCFSCHTAAAHRTLGLGADQLDRSFTYPTGETYNELTMLHHIGMFDQAPSSVDLPAPSSEDDDTEVFDRARAYLAANCSQCHRPLGPGGGAIDLRADIPLSEMHICNAAPSNGDLGVEGAPLVTPGDPSRSVLSIRMHTRGPGQMPPLATHLVDPDGTHWVDAFIRGLQSCD